MSRRPKFFHPLRVRYVEVDAQCHVFFGHYLTYFDIALVEYMRAIGCSYQDMLDSGVDMFYVDASCQYKGRARFDDLLNVHTCIDHIGNTSFVFRFAVHKQLTDELIATGKMVAVAIDVATQKPVRVPDKLRSAVDRFEGDPE